MHKAWSIIEEVPYYFSRSSISFKFTWDKKSTILTWIECFRTVIPVSIHSWLWNHSVESPSMVDPQWDIWYWGSKWNLHTVCWSVVGCEWGTTSVYFGITYVCFVPSRLPVFTVEPQYLLQDFFFGQKYHLKDTYKIFKKFHVGLKFEWGL